MRRNTRGNYYQAKGSADQAIELNQTKKILKSLNVRPKFETENSNQCFSQSTHPNWFKLSEIAYIYGIELHEFFQFFLEI